ncbi:MAG: two-component system sensor histidine kinase CreC [Burkholderiaceae bacterium]
MSKRNRIFIGILLAYVLGAVFLLYRQLEDIDPRYRESAEEALVETSHLLASLVETQVQDGAINPAVLAPMFHRAYSREFSAKIFGIEKNSVEVRVYVTDRSGRVIYDSTGRNLGADYSQWRDVQLTLRGEYGARTTADIDNDARTSVMYVGAPITYNNEIIGVVTTAKPVQSFGQFVQAARQKTIWVGIYSVAAVLLGVFILSVWLARPFGLIADYVRFVRAQRSFSLPRLGRRALGVIGAAYDEMRDALAGRNYVADYVQTLTHEVKSPLSAIRGAAELLQEPGMPEQDRARFAANISRETQRIQELVDRMMELTALESRKSLERTESVALTPLLQEIVDSAQTAARSRGINIAFDSESVATVQGDGFLLRRALSNLLDNAIDFSPDGGAVAIHLHVDPRVAQVKVRDYGPGIPDYAEGKVFEKFYSLARPHSQKKSTGLGLAFVKEIAELHHGRITLENAVDGKGAVATFSLPRT